MSVSVKPESESNSLIDTYVPFDKSLLRDLDTTGNIQSSVLSTIDDIMKQIVKDTSKYINNIASGDISQIDGSYLTSQAKNLKSILEIKFNLDVFDTSIKESKDKIKDTIRQESQLDEDRLAALSSDSTLDNVSDTIKKDYDAYKDSEEGSFSSVLNLNADYQFFKNVAFVAKNPEDAIPDEDVDEELNVAGGKVSLKDPISLQYFVDPVCSKKCKHSFEKTSIESHFSKGGSRCPIDGCAKTISQSDIYPDQLMKIRVAVYKTLEERDRDDDDDLERVI